MGKEACFRAIWNVWNVWNACNVWNSFIMCLKKATRAGASHPCLPNKIGAVNLTYKPDFSITYAHNVIARKTFPSVHYHVYKLVSIVINWNLLDIPCFMNNETWTGFVANPTFFWFFHDTFQTFNSSQSLPIFAGLQSSHSHPSDFFESFQNLHAFPNLHTKRLPHLGQILRSPSFQILVVKNGFPNYDTLQIDFVFSLRSNTLRLVEYC